MGLHVRDQFAVCIGNGREGMDPGLRGALHHLADRLTAIGADIEDQPRLPVRKMPACETERVLRRTGHPVPFSGQLMVMLAERYGVAPGRARPQACADKLAPTRKARAAETLDETLTSAGNPLKLLYRPP